MLDKKKRKQTNVNEENTENLTEENLTPTEDCTETQEKIPVEETNEDQEPAPEKTETEKMQEELDSLNEKLLRTMAEYDNYRKRSIKEKDSIYPLARSETVEKFLPVMDNFERAMSASCTDPDFKKGMEMIWNSFLQIMKDLSVEEIGKEGETFNPEVHNAVMHVEDEAYGESVVMQVLQKGYRIGDRVVRYAMVKVAN